MAEERKSLTPAQRLELAQKIEALVEAEFPERLYTEQEEALLLAYNAMTSNFFIKGMFASR